MNSFLLLFDITGINIMINAHRQKQTHINKSINKQSSNYNNNTLNIIIYRTPIDGIMEGYLTLIDIDISNQYGLKYYNQSNPYQNVSATFCHISWHQPKPQQNQNHKQQPKVKTFHDLISSPICQSTLYHVNDLYGDVIIPITLYDQEQLALSSQQQVIYVPPTVLIFHESNAGSTVLSNILNAFTAYHTETMRVYNEPYPLIKSLMGCDSIKTTGSLWGISCDTKSHMKLVQDIFYLLGRIPILISWPETHYIYYKMDAISSQYMNVFNAAMPSTSWIFLYRNSIEVLMSHFPHYYQLDQNHKTKIASIVTQYSYNNNNTNNDNTEQQYHDELNYYYRNHLKKPSNSKHKSLCLRYYGNMEQQPDILHEIVQQVDRTILSLSKEEYCAAYIATLVETAIRQHDDTTNASISSIPSTTTPRHWFINYNQLPYVIWEYILPQLLDGHRQITKEEREYMHYISTLYDTAKTSSSFTSSSSSLWSSLKTKTNNNNNKDNSNQHFVEDSIMKQNVAPPMIYDASQLFLDPIYNKMELIRQNQ